MRSTETQTGQHRQQLLRSHTSLTSPGNVVNLTCGMASSTAALAMTQRMKQRGKRKADICIFYTGK